MTPPFTNASEQAEREFLVAYRRLADPIFRYCLYRTYDREKAKEFTQETFIRAWRLVAEGQDIINLKALLYRIAKNLIIDDSRKAKTLSLDALMAEGFDPADPSADRRTAWQAEINYALSLLERLPTEYRECLELRYVHQLRVKDIAALLAVSENVISVRLHRATRELRRRLGPHQ